MKIQAKDLKVGQTIKDGSWTMVVERIEDDKQKNGTPIKHVYGTTERTNARKDRKRLGTYMYQNLKTGRTYKELTFLTIL